MAKIQVDANCGNSPRKAFLRDFNIAFAEENIPFILENVSEEIAWEIVGSKTIEGKANFQDALEKIQGPGVAELIISNIITHGREAAANGIIILENGDRYAFCDIYNFKGTTGTTLKKLTSFNIKT